MKGPCSLYGGDYRTSSTEFPALDLLPVGSTKGIKQSKDEMLLQIRLLTTHQEPWPCHLLLPSTKYTFRLF